MVSRKMFLERQKTGNYLLNWIIIIIESNCDFKCEKKKMKKTWNETYQLISKGKF